MAGDDVQNGETTDELQNLIAENKRLAQELERNNIPNKFARPDLWAGKNNNIGSAIFVKKTRMVGRSARRVRACVRASACAVTPPSPSDDANNTLPPHVCRKNLAVGGCACAHLG